MNKHKNISGNKEKLTCLTLYYSFASLNFSIGLFPGETFVFFVGTAYLKFAF